MHNREQPAGQPAPRVSQGSRGLSRVAPRSVARCPSLPGLPRSLQTAPHAPRAGLLFTPANWAGFVAGKPEAANEGREQTRPPSSERRQQP
jgi:hypothetical protein